MAKKIKVTNPVLDGTISMTLDYGNTYSDGSFHKGVDLITGEESNVIAIEDGVIVNCYKTMKGTNKDSGTKGMGNYVILEHSNGYRTRYQHMKYNTVCVEKGDKVKKGEKIGVIGNTGYSTGRHLHFDISSPEKVSGAYLSSGRYYVDPKPYLSGEKSLVKAPTKAKEEPKASNEYVVTAGALNVRKEPSLNAKRVDVLFKNDKVKVVDTKDNFAKIGNNRWVCVDYIKKV